MKTKEQKYQEAIARKIAYLKEKATAQHWSPEIQKELVLSLFNALRISDRPNMPDILKKLNTELSDSAKKYMLDLISKNSNQKSKALTGVDFGIMPEPEIV